VLGFELVNHAPEYAEGLFHWAMLRSKDVTFMLNTAYDEGQAPESPYSRGFVRMAIRSSTSPARIWMLPTSTCLPMESKSSPDCSPYGFKQLHVKDPDGYHLCLQHPV